MKEEPELLEDELRTMPEGVEVDEEGEEWVLEDPVVIGVAPPSGVLSPSPLLNAFLRQQWSAPNPSILPDQVDQCPWKSLEAHIGDGSGMEAKSRLSSALADRERYALTAEQAVALERFADIYLPVTGKAKAELESGNREWLVDEFARLRASVDPLGVYRPSEDGAMISMAALVDAGREWSLDHVAGVPLGSEMESVTAFIELAVSMDPHVLATQGPVFRDALVRLAESNPKLASALESAGGGDLTHGASSLYAKASDEARSHREMEMARASQADFSVGATPELLLNQNPKPSEDGQRAEKVRSLRQ